MNIYRIALIGFLIFLSLSLTEAASFDCRKAFSRIEKAICSDARLNDLDNQLGYLYREVKNSIGNPHYVDQFVRESRKWLKERNRCRNRNCIRQKYHNRITQLQSMLPHNTGNNTNQYICYESTITLLDRNFYQGCIRSNISCNDLGKKLFGRYPNTTMATEAFKQCKGDNTSFHNEPPRGSPAKRTIQIPAVTWGACMIICEDSSFCKEADHNEQTSVCTLYVDTNHPDYKLLQKRCSKTPSSHWIVSYKNDRWFIECSR